MAETTPEGTEPMTNDEIKNFVISKIEVLKKDAETNQRPKPFRFVLVSDSGGICQESLGHEIEMCGQGFWNGQDFSWNSKRFTLVLYDGQGNVVVRAFFI